MASSVSEIFSSYHEYLNNEQDRKEEIRTLVREIEQTAREILTVLQGIHQEGGIKQIPEICKKARILFEKVKGQYQELAKKIPSDQYYRFNEHWRFVNQRLAFLAALTVYLESEQLVQRTEVADLMGVCVKREDGFHLDLEDFLTGILQLTGELSRFAVNSVTFGDYNRPIRISRFMSEMNMGFRLLNLKNDFLRKKFDGLKYDIKKVEEVVYDLSIRGLKPQTECSEPVVTPHEQDVKGELAAPDGQAT